MDRSDMVMQFVFGVTALVPLFEYTYHQGWAISALCGVSLVLSFLLGGVGSRYIRRLLRRRRGF